MFTWPIQSREPLIKVYFRQYGVRRVLRNLLTYNMLTNFLRAPLPCPDKNILLIRGFLVQIRFLLSTTEQVSINKSSQPM